MTVAGDVLKSSMIIIIIIINIYMIIHPDCCEIIKVFCADLITSERHWLYNWCIFMNGVFRISPCVTCRSKFSRNAAPGSSLQITNDLMTGALCENLLFSSVGRAEFPRPAET